jgi:hypothetical protein
MSSIPPVRGSDPPTAGPEGIQGGDLLTTTLVSSEPVASTSEQGSGIPTTAFECPGAGKSNSTSFFISYLYFCVLVTPPKISDQGNSIPFFFLFSLNLSYFRCYYGKSTCYGVFS